MNDMNDEDILVLATTAHLSARARELWRPGMEGWVFLDLLREQRYLEDALRLSPYLLSPREAVWWGCLCVWHVTRTGLSELDRAALAAASRWVMEPREANRHGAGAAAEASGLTSAAGCLAAAAQWSAGPTTLTPRLVAAATFVAALSHEPMRFEERYRTFLDVGRELAAGRHRWGDSAAPVAQMNERDAAPVLV